MPVKSISCNIAIYPPAHIRRGAISLSKKLSELGTDFTLDDKNFYPHITLYMTEFPVDNLPRVKKELRNITQKMHIFSVTPAGIGKVRGHIGVDFKNIPDLVSLHRKIVLATNAFREGCLRPKDRERLLKHFFPANMERMLKEYGSSRAMKNYNPHLTLTKFTNDKTQVDLKLQKSKFSFEVNEIVLFQSGRHGACRKILARFRLS